MKQLIVLFFLSACCLFCGLGIVKVENEKRMTLEYARQAAALERIADAIESR